MAKKLPSLRRGAENALYFSERLRTALTATLSNPITVVEAPMGYGKTESVKAFLASSSVRVAWTVAQASSLESFWPSFCGELTKALPKSDRIVSGLKRLGFPDDQARISETLKILEKISFPRKTVLVFDDCHLLPRSFIAFCEGLAGLNSFNAEIVAITRHAWGEGLRLINASHTQSLLDRSLFALTPNEIVEYFSLKGVEITQEEALELHKSTEGWISALYLNFLWFQKNGSFSTIPEDLSVRMREMVYAPLSERAKELLTVLTPLERFTTAQAAHLYGDGVAPLLDELISKNAFVSFDQASKIYSPHAVFRRLLQKIFEEKELTIERRQAIYRACGDELMAAGEIASAMEAWYKAGDFERALTILESDMTRNLVTERAEFYVTMFKECPQDILENHLGAAFKYAIALFSVGDFSSFEVQLRWLADHCAALPKGEEGNRWRGELFVLLAITKFNDIEAMSANFQKALGLLKKPTILYGSDSPWSLGSPSVLFMFHRTSGHLNEELGQMFEHMPHYYLLASHHGAGAEYLMEAEALYLRGETELTEDICQKALEMASRHNQLGNVLCGLFIEIRLAILKGDPQALFGYGSNKGHVEDMRGLIARSRDGFMLHTADLCEGWLYASLGLYEKIPLWLRTKLGQGSRLYTFAKGFFPLVHGLAQLLSGDYAELIEETKAILASGAFQKNLLFFIYAKIYLAAALQKSGRGGEALQDLTLALEAALPDGLYMPFAENYDFIDLLLRKILGHGQDNETLSIITDLAKRVKDGREAVLIDLEASRSDLDLTARELETVRLLAQGFSTTDLAGKMGVTIHTVRAHLKSAARKAGTKSRVALLRKFFKQP
ncbi:MAG: LuxR C-terminal-related transcriptional regulator [Deltaproteobacteria bacterium]|jgi:LuxR family maltose regulon positive regulatory protein|nr:LuxR C-terminal-related transcriptional regulator [Deltaproteobacteria bacterium]